MFTHLTGLIRFNKPISTLVKLILGVIVISYGLLWLNNHYRVEQFAQVILKDKSENKLPQKSVSKISLNADFIFPAPAAMLKSVQLKPATVLPMVKPVLEPSLSRRTPSKEMQQQLLYQKISEGRGPDIQLALPKAKQQQEYLISKLYQCLGIGLGQYQTAQVTLVKNTLFGASERSKLLRLVQGELTEYERHLIPVNNSHQGSWVRLFPEYIDRILLLKLLSLVAVDQQLESVRGVYFIDDDQLWVKEIEINGQKINKSIRLSKLNCDD